MKFGIPLQRNASASIPSRSSLGSQNSFNDESFHENDGYDTDDDHDFDFDEEDDGGGVGNGCRNSDNNSSEGLDNDDMDDDDSSRCELRQVQEYTLLETRQVNALRVFFLTLIIVSGAILAFVTHRILTKQNLKKSDDSVSNVYVSFPHQRMFFFAVTCLSSLHRPFLICHGKKVGDNLAPTFFGFVFVFVF